MTQRQLACIILAAGKGTRMKSTLPKVLHPLGGMPMVRHVVTVAESLNPARIVVVIGPGMDNVAASVAPYPTVIQQRQAGTGDAVMAGMALLDGFMGDVLVLYGDSPLMTPATLTSMLDARRAAGDPAVVVLGMRPDNPGSFGRLVTSPDGGLDKIVEFLDANVDERAITLCNAGFMAFDGRRMPLLLAGIGNQNAKGEFYLTDAVAVARAQGHGCVVVEGPTDDTAGVNSRAELAAIERIFQARLRRAAMDNGATLLDPDSVYLAADTRLGRDVTVGQNVVFGPGVVVEDEVEIKAFSHLEGVIVRTGAVIGPFARLRPGSDVGEGAHVGNFVELKNTQLGAGAKANHLTYLGDSDVGPGSNIGAGTITCNYDGYLKHRTQIGAGVFIGSHSTLVAPVKVGDGAYTAAGTVVTSDVSADALAIARSAQLEKPGWAAQYRAVKAALKAKKG